MVKVLGGQLMVIKNCGKMETPGMVKYGTAAAARPGGLVGIQNVVMLPDV